MEIRDSAAAQDIVVQGTRTVGLITIGQSPRVDMVPEMSRWLGPARILERGALDGMSGHEISDLQPGFEDYPLVTRLNDGSSVIIAKRLLLPRIQLAVTELEDQGADVVVLVCTGEFPSFQHRVPLLTAERLFLDGTRAISWGTRVGVLCPLPDQEELTREKWSFLGEDLRVASGSPYEDGSEGLRVAARELGSHSVDYIVLDCMGYTQNMKELVTGEAGAPAILARSIVARLAAEVLW